MINKNLSKNVKGLRILKGLSQEQLAKQTGLSLRTIQRVEKGETNPTGETLKRISKTFDISCEQLLICTNNLDSFINTIEAKNEYLHIFNNKLIISKTKDYNNIVIDYGKSVYNTLKSSIVFLVFTPFFIFLASILYSAHSELSFFSGAFALFFLLMGIYTSLFTSSIPTIDMKLIKKIRIKSSFFGDAIVIYHFDLGIPKKRTIILEKNKIEFLKNTFLEENRYLSNIVDFKISKKRIKLEVVVLLFIMIIGYYKTNIFDNSILKMNTILLLLLSLFIIVLIVKGIIQSFTWEKTKN
jgi:transcriptional regulator with XRE-family HTH domain